MKIVEIEIRPMKLQRSEPFGVRTGAYATVPNTLVAIKTDEGLVGYGEAAPIVDYFGEGQHSIVPSMRDFLAPALIGMDPMNTRECIEALDQALPANYVAKAGLDIALHDLKGKATSLPVSTLIGGAANQAVPLTMSIGIDAVPKMLEKCRVAKAAGYGTLKLKGGQSVRADIELLTTIRNELGADGPMLRLDANAGYLHRPEVYQYVKHFNSLGMALLEQPFAAMEWDALRRLRDRLTFPILLDESMQHPWGLRELAKDPEGFVANVKVQLSGGIFRASQYVNACNRLAIPVMIGSQRESAIGNTASIHLASTVAGLRYTCDQRYAKGIDPRSEVATNAPSLDGAAVDVPVMAGLGLDIDWTRCQADQVDRLVVR